MRFPPIYILAYKLWISPLPVCEHLVSTTSKGCPYIVPFLDICVPNLTTKGQKLEMVGGGWSWVGGVIQEVDGGELSQRGIESKV